MFLRPLSLLLLNRGFKELIRGFRRRRRQLLWFSALGDLAQIGLDFADGARFLPGFAAGGLRGCGLVGFPATFWEHPVVAADGLDQEHGFAVVA